MMIARPWEKDNYPIQDALCSYNHSIFYFMTIGGKNSSLSDIGIHTPEPL